MKKLLISFSLLLSLVSCSSQVNLSNDEALAILKDNFKDDCVTIVQQRTLSHWTNHDEIMFGFQELEQSGLIKIEQKRVARGHFNTTTEFRWKPTAKAEAEYKKAGYAYLVSRANVLEIIGISLNEEAKTATVRFTYENKPTVFHLIRDKKSKCPEGINEATANFTFYDTGWKMEDI
ncbi:hypothetical protein [Winogradskyella haliclonae]|uniref:Lipoprotein n=1 Tax=Winogradskyella haliclonae TaxID=2048558 RepID=A0ABQ2C158_9FLAO|nr:hypothetical protein [Winogradskyella haliclonae]GGI58470.1 hypothetical protein GCM10011444_27790 [Winogradskyella haliclonae]